MEQLRSKVLLVLLVLAVTFGSASIAMAQGVAFSATSLPRVVRVEGVTEVVGEIVLTATNTGTITTGSSINIIYQATITNSPAAANVTCNTIAAGTGALASGNCTNMTVPAAVGAQLQIAFGANTAFVPGAVIDIAGVRINVSALGSGVTTVNATLSGVSANPTTNPITFTVPTVQVATVSSSLTATVPTGTPPSLLTCVINTSGTFTFSISATEKFPAALTSTADEGSFSTTPVAGNGSQIDVIISGVPTGFSVSATAFTPTAPSTMTTSLALPSTQAQGTTTGTNLTFSFPIATDNLATIETVTMTFTIFNAATVAPGGLIGPVTARVRIGPVPTTTPTIRFVDSTAGSGTVATISDCVTVLLFPFVSGFQAANVIGFDTGIAIANTSDDDAALGTGRGLAKQSGTCALTLFPSNRSTGVVGTPATVTTASVAAGATLITSLNSLGSTFAGLEGYIIAVCNFLGAHGTGFLLDGNGLAGGAAVPASKGQSGLYHALIIANPRVIVPAGENLNN